MALVQCMNPAADPVAGLEDRDLEARAGQALRGGEARDTGADNEYGFHNFFSVGSTAPLPRSLDLFWPDASRSFHPYSTFGTGGFQ